MTTSPATPPESAPIEAGGATIIPFPVRKPAAPAAEASPDDSGPADRLVRALAKLNAALAEQRQAVATWRVAMADLRTSTTGLSAGLHRYNASLGTLSDKVAAVNRQARDLEAWADGALASQGAADTTLRH